jgi:hypothetical protein
VARYLVRLALLATLAALAIPAAAAQAGGGLLTGLLGGGCGTDSAVFAPWNDHANYYFAANGGFESGAANWSLGGGSAVVGGSESYAVHGAGESSSLLIPAGGTASTTVCYGLLYPSIRFFVADASDQPATVHVRVVTKSVLGILSTFDGGSFQVSGGWQASPKLSTLLSALAAPLGTKSMTLQISVDQGSAQIDDLYIDPFVRDA